MELTEIFGAGAMQTSTHLIIPKNTLLGLTPSLNNRAEALLIAILLTARTPFEGVLCDENLNSIISESGENIVYQNSEIYLEINVNYWRKSFNSPYVIEQFLLHVYELLNI